MREGKIGMESDDARAAVMLALWAIRQKLGLESVRLDVLKAAVADHLTVAEYGATLREMRERGLVFVDIEPETVALTELGLREAEILDERIKGPGRREDDHQRAEAAVVEGRGGSEAPRGSVEGGDAEAHHRPEVQPGGDRRLTELALEALTDAVSDHGFNVPLGALVGCLAFRLAQDASEALGFEVAQAMRLLGDGAYVALLGTRARLLNRGHRAVSMRMTALGMATK